MMTKVNMWRHVGDALGQLTVSKEEADLLAQENVEMIANTEHELAEAERHTEIAENLEDVAAVADRVTNAEPKDLAFIDTNVSMATAGTGITPEEVMPALENYAGGTIDTRGLKATAEGFRSAVSEGLTTLGARLTGGLKSASKQAGQLKNEVTNATTGSHLTVTLGSHLVGALTCGDKVVSNGAELIAALKEQIRQTDIALVNYTTQLGTSADRWIGAFNALGVTKRELSAEVMTKALESLNFDSLASELKASTGDDPRYRDKVLRVPPPLLGRGRIYIVSDGDYGLDPIDKFTESYATFQKPDKATQGGDTFTFKDAAEIATVKQLVVQLLDQTASRGVVAQRNLGKVIGDAAKCQYLIDRLVFAAVAPVAIMVGPVATVALIAGKKLWDLAQPEVRKKIGKALNSYQKKAFQPALPLAQHNVYVAKGLLALLKATA